MIRAARDPITLGCVTATAAEGYMAAYIIPFNPGGSRGGAIPLACSKTSRPLADDRYPAPV